MPWVLLVSLVPLVGLIACGSPRTRLEQAEQALAEARRSVAHHAPELLGQAEDLLARARVELAEQEVRSWAQRDPRRIWRLLDDLERILEQAPAAGTRAAARAKAAAWEELARAHQEVTQTRIALERMPSRRDTISDVGEMRGDLVALEGELSLAGEALERGDFRTALRDAELLVERARIMARTVERAHDHLLLLPGEELGRSSSRSAFSRSATLFTSRIESAVYAGAE